MPEDTAMPLHEEKERRAHLPPHIPIDRDAIGEYFDSLSEEEKREFAIGLALGNAALSEALSKDLKTGLLQAMSFKSKVISHVNIPPSEEIPAEEVHHGLMLIDLDDFKLWNTDLGYQATDENALKPAAEAIKSNIRSDQDIAARFGGEEFLVFLSYTDAEGIALVAQKLQAAINNIHPLTGRRLGVSIGWAVFPHHGNYEVIFASANAALLKAKSMEGKNRIIPAEELAKNT